MYLLYYSIKEQKGQKIKIFVPLIFMVAIFITGAREIFISFILVNIVIVARNFNAKRFFIFSLTSFSVFFVAYTLIITGNNKDIVFSMIDFQKSSYDEIGERLNALFPLMDMKTSNSNLFFGIGPGKFGQEARLDQDIYRKYEFISLQFYNSNHNTTMGFNTDAGLSKIFIELGLLGIFILSVCFLPILLKSVMVIFSNNRNSIKFCLSLYIIIWIALFTKSHPVISDIFLTSFLYFSVGFIYCVNESKSI
jgi:hypothetical protein